MRQLSLIAAAALAALPAGPAPAADKAEAKGKKVEYQAYTEGYFESNKSGLKGDTSLLTFTDAKAFDDALKKVPPLMGKKFEYLPTDAFDTKLAAAVIRRGNAIWTYKVDKVTVDGDTLYVQYDATSKDGGTATFASPLIVAVDRGKYTSVVFIENGEKVGKAKVDKDK
jgi:hypothetical protein